MKIADCIKLEGVAVDVNAESKTSLLQILSKKAGELLDIDQKEILTALRNREKLGSTGIGSGIALPHAPVAGVTAPFGLLVRLDRPVDFDAIDELPVDIVCVVLTPADKGSANLNLLSLIARQLRSPAILGKVRSAFNKEGLYAAITEC